MPTKASLVFAILAVTSSTLAQSPRPARVEFEVAVIRPTATAARAIRIDGAQVHFTGFLLREYVARAYQVRVSQVIGPDWLSSSPFDIDAKFPEGSSPAQVTDMLQALLADRFSLEQHREQKEMAVYAIVVGKPPLRLKDSVSDPNADSRIEALVNITVDTSGGRTAVDLGHGSSYTVSDGKFEGKRFTGAMLASTLERYCDRPVLDMTGVTSVFDFSFDVTPEESQVLGMRAALYAGVKLPPQLLNQLDAGGNPLFGAMQQLGLKLDARKAPIDVLVVDAVRRTPREN
jgi:uncharacterized protein (TIGR03435 family)